MVATTAVVAFESVGAILVIAFFIVPASGSYLLTDRLSHMIVLSVILGIISAVTGYLFAILADVSIAGSMATTAGIVFGLIWVFAPNRGLISRWRRTSKQRFEIDVSIMLTHIHDEINLNRIVTSSSISNSLGWTTGYSEKLSTFAQEKKLVTKNDQGNLLLTENGSKKVENYNN